MTFGTRMVFVSSICLRPSASVSKKGRKLASLILQKKFLPSSPVIRELRLIQPPVTATDDLVQKDLDVAPLIEESIFEAISTEIKEEIDYNFFEFHPTGLNILCPISPKP